MKPVIGITTYGPREQQCASPYYDYHYALPKEYIDSIIRAGGVPLLIPPDGVNEDELWRVLDGIILTGGADVSPVHYRGDIYDKRTQATALERDIVEIALIRKTMEEMDMPVLCICRGMQILNISLGGSLHSHIPDIRKEDIHRQAGGGWQLHECVVKAESRLAHIMGAERVRTYSGHHQAVDQIAEGLEAVAVAPDNLVEALIAKSHPWVIGVQWHPEKSTEMDITQQRLFDELVRVAAAQRK